MPPLRHLLAGLMLLCSIRLAAADLQPFQMPWNDASAGITNLQNWQLEPAGAHGWVQVTADGHYAVGGERIRFLGVNVSAASAMPTHARAEAHAARLARFGFNAVRLHHLEAPWDKANVLIDYASGSSRNLSADRLEKLHYFVARLAEKGLYSNVNLLVSREFQAADGLGAEIAQMGWKDQHVLGFFNATALALHKEHATKLLTAPNPYRNNQPLGNDPAVPFVEIMNENGLMQKWFEGVVDTMPAVYRAQLQVRWNQWLSTRYASTAALLTGWGAIDQPLGTTLLTNGTFSAGTTGWNAEKHDTAVATFTGTNDYFGQPSLRINVTTAGSADWHVQLNQSPLTVAAGGIYTVTFWAKASGAIPLYCVIGRAYGDYGSIGSGLSSTLGTSWQQYTVTVGVDARETNARLNFGGFGSRICSVWLADVRLQPGGRVGGLPAGRSLEAATVPLLLRNNTGSGYTLGQRQDWTRFVLGLEKAYWDTMRSHVKQTLGYPGIVWGTIVANSPANAQAGMDAMDSHAYWQHPSWPAGQDWDPVTWTIPNTSMVNDANGGTLGGMARQRVAGRPHNVTEYQHPSPNTYSSEGPLLAAAYASLQDWDSLWMFAYETTEAEYVTGFFDHGTHPGRMANNLLAAALFRRGDVARAVNEYRMALTPEREVEATTATGSAWNVADGGHLGVPASLALASRLSLSIGTNATGLTTPPAAPAGSSITADTGELKWDNSVANKGVVTVNTARTKAVVGFISGRTWTLGGVTIAPGAARQDWCTIGITFLEGAAFDQVAGGRALIVATGDQENTGMIWKDATRTSVGSNWGTAPTLVEVISAGITLPVAASRVSAWALDARGQRGAALTVTNQAGKAHLELGQNGATLWYEVVVVGRPPAITAQPQSQAVVAGQAGSLSVTATGASGYQWYKGGVAMTGATGSTIASDSVGSADAGIYDVIVTGFGGETLSAPAVVGIVPTAGNQTAGSVATRVAWQDIHHPNGNVYDQFMLNGASGTFTADSGQIARMSFLDENDSIVQVEMSGPGAITVVLANATGPMAPALYNQSGIYYMKGKPTIILAGANTTTHFTIYSVGPAINPGVTYSDVPYYGWADVAVAGIISTDGKLGGIHQGNVDYNASTGFTGIYAPTVTTAASLLVVHNIAASGTAIPYLYFGTGGAVNIKIAGGTLAQPNGDSITVSGLSQVQMGTGRDSCGVNVPAQAIQVPLVNDAGTNVTSSLVVGP